MSEPLLAAVRDVVDGGRALHTVEAIARFHRIQSTAGYDAAAAWVRGRLTGLGLRLEGDELPGDGRSRHLGWLSPEGWNCRAGHAWLHAGGSREPVADFGAEPLSLVQRSAAARGRWPLVHVPDGAEADPARRPAVAGAIVLTRGPAMLAHERWVLGEGAAGLVCDGRRLLPPVRTHDTDPDALAYTSFWWPEAMRRGFGIAVTPRRGDAWRARLDSGERLELEVAIEASFAPTPVPLVSAVLEGDWPGEILLTAHLCHPRPGANDNASGVAAAIEAIEALARLRHDGRFPRAARSVRVLFMPELTGTAGWLARDPARAGRTHAALNLDMVGESQARCGSTLLIEHPPHFMGSFAEEWLREIRHECQDWVTGFSGPGHYSLARMAEVPYSGGSDHMMWIDPALAVPCPMLIQWPDRFYHSSLDGPEQVDPASLALAARTGAAYAGTLARVSGEGLHRLAARVARGARRRLLAALDRDADAARVAAELSRGRAALASIGRLLGGRSAADPDVREWQRVLPLLADELEGFHASEIEPHVHPAARSADHDARVPRRVTAAPLELLRHLLPGWEAAGEDLRREWRGLEAGLPAPNTVLDVAWYAADGVRTVSDVGELVRGEGWEVPLATLGRFFELASDLGLATWQEGAHAESPLRSRLDDPPRRG